MNSRTAHSLGLVLGFLLPVWNPDPSVAAVPDGFQRASYWCWAASAEMVMRHLGAPRDEVRQEIQAGRLYPPPSECSSTACSEFGGSVSASCNRGGFPQFDKFGFVAEVTRPFDPLPWTTLKCELDSSRPVVFAWEWLDKGQPTGTGHMMVARSGEQAEGERWIAIRDPSPVCVGESAVISYREYRDGPGHAHWIDYFGIRRPEQPVAPCETLPEGPESALEALSPGPLLDTISRLARTNSWLRESIGLRGLGLDAACDPEFGIPQVTVSVEALRRAGKSTRLRELVEETRRRRYRCRSGTTAFSAVLVEQPPGYWFVARLGDANAAARFVELFPGGVVPPDAREVFVQGLNLRFLWLPSEERVHLLFGAPDLGVPVEPRFEFDLLRDLRESARSFRSLGPT